MDEVVRFEHTRERPREDGQGASAQQQYAGQGFARGFNVIERFNNGYPCTDDLEG
jgi:hypothetical protein